MKTDVRITDGSMWWRGRQRFTIITFFPDDPAKLGDASAEETANEFSVVLHPDEPIWRATEVLWMDYCIMHHLSRHTPYRVTLPDAGDIVNIEQTLRDSGLVPAHALELDSDVGVYIQVRFERLAQTAE
jgi:hypothetical protein